MREDFPTPDQLNSLPCEHRHHVQMAALSPVGNDEVHEEVTLVSCQLIDSALGWWAAFSSDLCKRCAEHHGQHTDLASRKVKWGQSPAIPKYNGLDPVSEQFSDMALRQISSGIDESTLNSVMGMGRDKLIERAKTLGVPFEHILEMIIASVQKHGIDSQVALEIADRNGLFEDTADAP